MALSREQDTTIDTFLKNRQIVIELNTKDTEGLIKALMGAMFRHEYLNANNKFISSRLEKIKNPLLKQALYKLKEILTIQFTENSAAYCAENPYYEAVRNFAAAQKDWHEKKELMIFNHFFQNVDRIYNYFNNCTIKLVNDKNHTFFAYFQLHQELSTQINHAFKQLFIMRDALQNPKIIEKTRVHATASFYAMINLKLKLTFNLQVISVDSVAKGLPSAPMEVATVDALVEQLEVELTCYSSAFQSESIQLYKDSLALLSTVKKAALMLKMHINSGGQILEVTAANTGMKLRYENDHDINNDNKFILISLAQRSGVDESFGGRVFPEDLPQTKPWTLKETPRNHSLLKDRLFCLHYGLLDTYVEVAMNAEKKEQITHHLDTLKQRVFSSFSLIPQYVGMWDEDKDCSREFNFVLFCQAAVLTLKGLKFDLQDKDDDVFISELSSLLERSIAVLYEFTHRSPKPFESRNGFCFDNELHPSRIKFYSLVLRREHLFLIAEFLVQLSRFKYGPFRFKDTEEIIKAATPAGLYQKHFGLDNRDGLMDIIFRHVNAIDRALPPIPASAGNHLPAKPTPEQIQAEQAAEAAYTALMSELEQERKDIENKTRNQMLHHKQQNKIPKIRLPKPATVINKSDQKANPESGPLSEEARLFYEAGRLYNLKQIDLEQKIARYKTISDRLVDDAPESDIDYLFVAAAFAEQARALMHKIQEARPESYSGLDGDSFLKMLSEQTAALKLADQAHLCFINQVEPKVSQYEQRNLLKMMEDLADHIRSTLNIASNELKIMHEAYNALIDNIEKNLERKREARNAAFERLGPELWVKNHNNYSIHTEQREHLTKELTRHRSAVRVLESMEKTKLKPIQNNINYLCGSAPFPLLKESPEAQYDEDSLMQGKGNFKQRLHMLNHASKLLKQNTPANQIMHFLLEVNKDEAEKALISLK